MFALKVTNNGVSRYVSRNCYGDLEMVEKLRDALFWKKEDAEKLAVGFGPSGFKIELVEKNK